MALTSNFKIRKTATCKSPIVKPESISIVPGSNPLELEGRVNRVYGAISYVFQYAKDEMMAPDNWQGVPGSTTKCIITNLESGVIYNCRVAAIGTRNQMMYSDIIRCRVA